LSFWLGLVLPAWANEHAPEATAPAAETTSAHEGASAETPAELNTPSAGAVSAETHLLETHEKAAPPAGAQAHGISLSKEEDYRREGRGLINLGTSLTERGDFAAAEIAFRRIMNDRGFAQQEQRDALLGIARMYRRQAIYTKAAAVYEKFLKLYSDDARVPDALLELGRTQRAMGAHKNAINRFYNVINSTLKLPPESYEHYQLLAKTAQFEIAETHFETGNFAEAAKFFDRLRLLDLAPEDRARAHFKAACSLLNAGELDQAIGKLNQYLEQWPADTNTPEARYLLALTLRKLGRTEEALATTLALLRDEHSNASADPKGWAYWQRRTGNQLANDFFQNGDTLSAVAIYEGLARLSPENNWRLPIIYQTGLCYERLRQTERATKAYREIAESVAGIANTATTPELTELARMANWRIGQMEWSGQTERQLHQFFSAATPAAPARPAPPPAPTVSANDSHASPAATPGSL
jgi:TolA-binding protein